MGSGHGPAWVSILDAYIALEPQEKKLNSLCLSFYIFKMEVLIIPASLEIGWKMYADKPDPISGLETPP